jgi:hypothetical protein
MTKTETPDEKNGDNVDRIDPTSGLDLLAGRYAGEV